MTTRPATRPAASSSKRCSPKAAGSGSGDPAQPPIIIRPLTPSRWKDAEALFGPNGACAGCWCLWWRLPLRAFEAGKGEKNRLALRALVQAGPPPGLIAYSGRRPAPRRRPPAEPVGWIALAPRASYPRLAGSRVLAPPDDTPVWSVTCFFIARGWRRRGVSRLLLEAAAEYARKRGASVLEGYPTDPRDPKQADAFVFTGLASTFRAAGFTEVARRSATRPIMRRNL